MFNFVKKKRRFFLRFTRLFSLVTLSSIWQKASGADAFARKFFFRFLKDLSQCFWLAWSKDCFPSKCLWLVLKKLYSDRLELVGGPVFAARGSLRIFDCRKERTFLMVNPPLALHWEEKRYSSRELIFSILTCQTKKHNQVKATFNQFYCFVGRSCVHRIIALFSGAGWLHLTCLLRQCVMGIGNHYWPDSTNLS